MMKRKWFEAFRNPDGAYRSIPFWSWNDRLTDEELTRQINEMAQKGMGGFFMHSRDGLETPYMSDEWMERVRTSAVAAKKAGITAYIYDEDRWPSGAAGGKVSSCGDEYRMKALVIFLSEEPLKDDFLFAYALRLRDKDILTLRPYDGTLQKGETLAGFKKLIYDKCEWFNNDTYSDNMNPECVRKFIELVYEPYERLFEGKLSDAVGGIFTDEPNIHGGRSEFSFTNGFVPWTDRLEEEFRLRRGYEIARCIPYLFFEGEESFQSRHDFWRTLGELFTESYIQQIYEWCDQRGLSFTGHFLYENDLGTATRCCGGVMKNYRYQHIPGMDLLTDQNEEYLTIRQCASVARQTGRKTAISEMYGCTGWQSDFDMQRRVGDWHAVQGINLRCQHLSLYSLKGCRKRDYPSSFNYNCPWWKLLPVSENYFTRLNTLLAWGEDHRDVLVLHPQSTAWGMLGSDTVCPSIAQDGRVHLNRIDSHMKRVDEYGHRFNALLKTLFVNHVDYDLGDETIMAEMGSVADGCLQVGQCSYRTVVIPWIETVLSSTLELLREFVRQGGKVICLSVPDRVDGVRIPMEFPEHQLCADPEEVLSFLPRHISFTDRREREVEDVVFMHRREGEKHLIFAVNLSKEKSAEGFLTLEGEGRLYEAECQTGEVYDLGDYAKGLPLAIPPAGSRVLILDPDEVPARKKTEPAGTEISFGDCWEYSLLAPNLLVLDRCSAYLEGKQLCAEIDVWRAQRILREKLGMRQVYYNGLPQRYQWADLPHPGDGAEVRLEFSFEVADLPRQDIFVIVEQAEKFEAALNGNPATLCPGEFFLDRAFGLFRLTGLKAGTNRLTLSCRYQNSFELEDIFLAGSFGVDEMRRVTHLPQKLKAGDWCEQGLMHYCGSVIYRKKVEVPKGRSFLSLPPISGAVSELRVEGAHRAYIIEKHETCYDFSDFADREVLVELEVIGTPKNMLGPLHQVNPYPAWTDWRDFRTEGEQYNEGYTLMPFGVNVTVRKDQ